MILSGSYAIATDQAGWHGKQVQQALIKRGHQAHFVSLQDCLLQAGPSAASAVLPDFGDDLPEGLFVRGVPGGSLEEVVFYLDILHALEALGVGVYNDASAIERSVDKARASFLFAHHGIPTPRTVAVRNLTQLRGILAEWFDLHRYVVIKPMFGSQGKGLMRLSREQPHPDYDLCHGIYYIQEFIESADEFGQDWRVLVVGGEAVAVMRREGEGWISNIANGGQGYRADLEPELENLAVRAVAAVGMQYAGVDLMRDREGRLWVTEVNSIPAWRGLQEVNDVHIASQLVDGFLAHCSSLREG